MLGLEFNAADHSYRLDGAPVVGVTSALKVITDAAYAFVDPDVMAEKAAFGTAVHRMIELDCLGLLDTDDLDPDLLPYFAAWREFLAASGFVFLLSEQKLASRRFRFAGQLDLFGRLNGIPALIDAKCVTTVMPSTGPQTAAYREALSECRPDLLPKGSPCRRYALQLRPSLKPGGAVARWHLVPFTKDAEDLRLFLACLTVTNHLRGLS
jgi:hypothetical protein